MSERKPTPLRTFLRVHWTAFRIRLLEARLDILKRRQGADTERAFRSMGPMKLTPREEANLIAADKPHEHFQPPDGFGPKDFLALPESQKEQILACIECRCRVNDRIAESVRFAVEIVPELRPGLEAFERVRAEAERTHPLRREEKAWRDADKDTPQ